MPLVIVNVEGRVFEFERPAHCGGDYPADSLVKVCPRCCLAWCKMHIDGKSYHYAQSAACRWCDSSDPSDPVPGSLLTEAWKADHTDWGLLEALPLELLKREALLCFKQLDKELYERNCNTAIVNF